jgi:hypothetical protein
MTGLYGRDTWQHDSLTGGVRRAEVAHTWANDRMTRGTFRLVFKGATWPSHGPPRGTLSLAVDFGLQNFGLAFTQVEPATSWELRLNTFGLTNIPCGGTCITLGRNWFCFWFNVWSDVERAGA